MELRNVFIYAARRKVENDGIITAERRRYRYGRKAIRNATHGTVEYEINTTYVQVPNGRPRPR